MARTATLSRWLNKTDITLYYLGKKVFRGNQIDCETFEKSFLGVVSEPIEKSVKVFGLDAGITENEAKVLRAIATNCFNVLNYDIPTCYEEACNTVWSNCIDDAEIPSGLAPRSIAGVCGSLARKSLVICDGRGDDDDGIRMTEAGFDAMMKFYGGNLSA